MLSTGILRSRFPVAAKMALLIAGTIVNPALFLPLAWKESIADTLGYRVVTVLSFSAMSVATVGAAVAGFQA